MALDFPSGVVDEFEWTDPSNDVKYIYDISKYSWTAKGGASGGGLQPEDIDTDKGLEIGANGKLGIKTYEDYGIQMDSTEGIRLGDSWSNVPSL